MKKLLFLISITYSVACFSADITLNWTMPSGDVLQNDGVTSLPSNSLFLLYWSPDGSTSAPGEFNPFEPLNTDHIFLDWNRNPDPGYFENQGGTYSNSTAGFESGSVYTRVFDYQGIFSYDGISETFVYDVAQIEGSFYETSNSSSLPFASPIPNNHFPFENEVVILDQQFFAIPEPTTLMALLVGIVGLVGFRRHLLKK